MLPSNVTYTLNSTYNEKKYAEIFLHYRWLFLKGDIIIGKWEIFGVEVFLHYSQFFIKGNFFIGRVEFRAHDFPFQIDPDIMKLKIPSKYDSTSARKSRIIMLTDTSKTISSLTSMASKYIAVYIHKVIVVTEESLPHMEDANHSP